MAEDTAVLDTPDTGLDEAQAPAEELETDALAEQPETGPADDDGPETETLTREQAEALAAERVQAVESRIAQERADALAEYQKQQAEQRRNAAAVNRQGEVQNRLNGLVQHIAREVEDGRLTTDTLKGGVNPKVLADIVSRVDTMSFETIHKAYEDQLDTYLATAHPGFAVPVELVRRRERAIAANDWAEMADSKVAILEAALTSKVESKLRAEWEAEQAEKQKTGALKASDKTVKGRSGPTGVTGGAPPKQRTFRTQQEVDMALYKNEINTSTAREWLAKGLPYS